MTSEINEPTSVTINRTVRTMPVRRPNIELRAREYLTEIEVQALMGAAANRGRHGRRDSLMILIAYRHGLRAKELVTLRWEQIDFIAATIHVNRVKRGNSAVHPLARNEVSALRSLHRERAPGARFVFVGERGPFSTAAFSRIIERAAKSIDFPLAAHPHMLRHACGYKLANDGQDTRAIQDYLGHRNIQHTVRYTALSSSRFRNFWAD